ncbi:Phospholipase D1, partial [Rhizopus stolonifer]
MSNPIADTADYFSEKEEQRPVNKNLTKPGLRIFPSQQHSSTYHENDILSPESPESRRPHPQQRNLSDFDPKLQWQRVLKHLPRHHPSHLNREQVEYVSDDNYSTEENHEMRRYHQSYNDQDDELPDTNHLHQQEETNEESDIMTQPQEKQQHEPDNYFVNPFDHSASDTNSKTTEGTEAPITPPLPDAVGQGSQSVHPISTTSTSSNSSGGNTSTQLNQPIEGKAKTHWSKTLDKVRLIANLQALPLQLKAGDLNSTSPLVPYYPPLFDPVFIALSKDQHGNPWVAITDSALSTQGINQWVFRIELQYGDLKWVIKRTIADFVSLHYTLKFKSSISDSVPSPPRFPSQLESWLSSAKGTIGIVDSERGEDDEKYQIALKRRKALTKYLRKLLIRAHMRANYDICEFLEISAASIVEDMGWKGKEGFLEHKVNFVVPRLCHVLKPHLWNTQWVLLRDSYVAFISGIASKQINDVFLFDKSLVVSSKAPGILGKYHNHIVMENKFRRIELKGSRREIEEWRESIDRVLTNSPWVKNHRFGSFAPIRHNAKVRWFVDGEDHFNAVGEAILSAKSEIYIMDWWLSPELYLRRPPEKNQEFRIDRLLKRKAEEGVRIYIIVYKEMAVALTINSAHTKSWLQSLHNNIIVVRHPDHRSIDNNVLFWSHHEKIVIVDNRLAFLGGLDLCWGRYDSHKHRITDYPAEGHTDQVFPGQDYSNPRVKDFVNVAQYDLTLVDKNISPRMPWHDMTVGMVGPIARDVARHFIQRWNFLKASKGMHRPTVPFLMPK